MKAVAMWASATSQDATTGAVVAQALRDTRSSPVADGAMQSHLHPDGTRDGSDGVHGSSGW